MVQQIYFEKRTNDSGLDKNDGTLNLILCCTTFGDNHCKQVISVSLNETSAPADGHLWHLFLKRLQLSQV